MARTVAAGRGQDARQLHLSRDARHSVSARPSSSIAAATCATGGFVLDDRFPQHPLGQRPRTHSLAFRATTGASMDHWRSVLPAPVTRSTTRKRSPTWKAYSRRLLAACGLEWDPACLEFHRRAGRSARPRPQVRQPVYSRRSAAGRTTNSELAELFAALTGCADNSAARPSFKHASRGTRNARGWHSGCTTSFHERRRCTPHGIGCPWSSLTPEPWLSISSGKALPAADWADP